ncbi:hypothetical protein [Bdellovibrio svalbardensis]|uniref:Protease n=1 Tax=Bdellovibrio svalbardensis TaxID=2972972 RepID=A0ABT6DI63_9BACT|nr:hypothetical protein [Bdellovibrio svalbardensis]MDG0816471.1 hypothetical protein [Bdellovibrio svalbardensis]
MKKTIFLSLLCLLSSSAFANEQPVIAQLHPAVVDGAPMFSTFWSEKNKVGFIQMGLAWSVFDPTVHGHGFKFANEIVTSVNPVLSVGCQIKNVKGTFNYIGGANGPNNPLVINLAGNCAGDIAEFENNQIHLSFKNVSSLDGLMYAPELDVVISH